MVALSVTVSQGGRLPRSPVGNPQFTVWPGRLSPAGPVAGVTDSTDELRNPHIIGRRTARYLASSL